MRRHFSIRYYIVCGICHQPTNQPASQPPTKGILCNFVHKGDYCSSMYSCGNPIAVVVWTDSEQAMSNLLQQTNALQNCRTKPTDDHTWTGLSVRSILSHVRTMLGSRRRGRLYSPNNANHTTAI